MFRCPFGGWSGRAGRFDGVVHALLTTPLRHRYGSKTCTLLIGSNQAVAAPPGEMIFCRPFSVMTAPYVPCLLSAPEASSGVVRTMVCSRDQDLVVKSKNCDEMTVPVMFEAMNSPPKE